MQPCGPALVLAFSCLFYGVGLQGSRRPSQHLHWAMGGVLSPYLQITTEAWGNLGPQPHSPELPRAVGGIKFICFMLLGGLFGGAGKRAFFL